MLKGTCNAEQRGKSGLPSHRKYFGPLSENSTAGGMSELAKDTMGYIRALVT